MSRRKRNSTAKMNTRDQEPYKEEDDEDATKMWDCGSPLYDSYELASLGHVLDRHTMALPAVGGSRRLKNQRLSDQDSATQEERKAGRAQTATDEWPEKKEEKQKGRKAGFFRIRKCFHSWKKWLLK